MPLTKLLSLDCVRWGVLPTAGGRIRPLLPSQRRNHQLRKLQRNVSQVTRPVSGGFSWAWSLTPGRALLQGRASGQTLPRPKHPPPGQAQAGERASKHCCALGTVLDEEVPPQRARIAAVGADTNRHLCQ